MKKIGLSGNIASGKSTTEKIIKDLGYKVIDADFVCHELMANNKDVIGEIKRIFSEYDVFDDDGGICRRKIAEIVFASNEYRKRLENLLHPVVITKIKEFFNKYPDEKFVFASVPLLFEAGMEKLFDKIIFVSADTNLRLKRLMDRNNLTEDEAKTRVFAQKAENDKIKKADFVIYNNYGIGELIESTKEVLKQL